MCLGLWLVCTILFNLSRCLRCGILTHCVLSYKAFSISRASTLIELGGGCMLALCSTANAISGLRNWRGLEKKLKWSQSSTAALVIGRYQTLRLLKRKQSNNIFLLSVLHIIFFFLYGRRRGGLPSLLLIPTTLPTNSCPVSRLLKLTRLSSHSRLAMSSISLLNNKQQSDELWQGRVRNKMRCQ